MHRADTKLQQAINKVAGTMDKVPIRSLAIPPDSFSELEAYKDPYGIYAVFRPATDDERPNYPVTPTQLLVGFFSAQENIDSKAPVYIDISLKANQFVFEV